MRKFLLDRPRYIHVRVCRFCRVRRADLLDLEDLDGLGLLGFQGHLAFLVRLLVHGPLRLHVLLGDLEVPLDLKNLEDQACFHLQTLAERQSWPRLEVLGDPVDLEDLAYHLSQEDLVDQVHPSFPLDP